MLECFKMKQSLLAYILAAGLCLSTSLSKAEESRDSFAGFNFDRMESSLVFPNFSQALKFSPAPVPVGLARTSEIVPPGLWNTLKAPDETSLEIIEASFPQWDISSIREVPFKAADAMIAKGVEQKMSALDFFTNSAWQGPHSYYLSQETLSKVMAKYNLHTLVPAGGQSVDGLPFHMQMALLGNGQIVMFMDQDGFNFTNSDYAFFQYNGHPFTFGADRVITQKIMGPGDLRISGLRVNVTVNSFIHPSLPIVEARKISKTKQHVETSLGGGDAPLYPMALRAAKENL